MKLLKTLLLLAASMLLSINVSAAGIYGSALATSPGQYDYDTAWDSNAGPYGSVMWSMFVAGDGAASVSFTGSPSFSDSIVGPGGNSGSFPHDGGYVSLWVDASLPSNAYSGYYAEASMDVSW